MIINHNIASLNTYNRMNANQKATESSLAKLSSGLRINSAADDAAGLAISEKMRGQIRGLDQATRNAQDSQSLLQTAEGGLNETQSILQRMRELAVQSASDTNTTSDRAALQTELGQLTTEVDRIANTTEFNTKKLLNGNLAGADSRKYGNGAIESSFANGAVKISFGGNNLSKMTLFSKSTDVIHLNIIGITKGANYLSTGGITGGTFSISQVLNNINKISVAGGNINISVLGFSGTGLTVAIKLTSDKNLKAGDSITISLQAGAIAVNSNKGIEAQIGANSGQQLQIGIDDMDSKSLGLRQNNGNALDITSQKNADGAVFFINNAITAVSMQRSQLGALSNRLDHTVNNLTTSSENLTSAESRIRDVDMAKEMTNFQKNNILNQASQAMLAQANQLPQGVLQLLK